MRFTLKDGLVLFLVVALALSSSVQQREVERFPAQQPPGQGQPPAGAQQGKAAPKLDDDVLDWLSVYTQQYFGLDLRSAAAVAAISGIIGYYGVNKLLKVMIWDRTERKNAESQMRANEGVREVMELLARSHNAELGRAATNATERLTEANKHLGQCKSWFRWIAGFTVGAGAVGLGVGGWLLARDRAARMGKKIEDIEREEQAKKLRAPLMVMEEEEAKRVDTAVTAKLTPFVPDIRKALTDNQKAIRASLVREEVARSRGKSVADNTKEVDAALERFGDAHHMERAILDSMKAVVPAGSDPTQRLDERLEGVLKLRRGSATYDKYVDDVAEEALRRTLPTVLPRARVREYIREALVSRVIEAVDRAIQARR